MQEKFEDGKRIIRLRKSRNRQYDDQKKRGKYKQWSQNT